MNRHLPLLLAVLACLPIGCEPPAPGPYNVLFIAVDDLRPELGAYGASHMVTPAMDQLAAEGRLFQHHYVHVPTCGASRFALLTGQRPKTPAHLSNQALRDLLPTEEQAAPETFAHHLRRNGYKTVSLGKIGHYVDGKIYSYEGEGGVVAALHVAVGAI